MKFHLALRHHRAGFFHARIFQKPLLAQARLDRHIGAFAVADVVRVRLFLFQRAEFGDLFHGHLARLETVEAAQIRARCVVHLAVRRDNFNRRELVPRADFKVRFVMRGRHFQNAGAKFKIHMLVADDRNQLLFAHKFRRQRTQHVLADEMRVTRVFRIHGHGGVARNRFRPRRRNRQERRTGVAPVSIFIFFFFSLRQARRLSYGFGHFDFEIIEKTFLLLHHHFFVGQRRKRRGTPVHHALAAIDEAFLVEVHKHALHAARILRVHREPFARPVARRAELFQLLDDDAALFIFPFPDFLQKFFTAKVVAMFDFSFLLERALDDGLRGDASVIRAGQPQNFLAVHARLAGEDVLDRVVEHMAEREHAGDVRRRDDDGICGLRRFRIRDEKFSVEPELIPFVLDRLRLVCFWDFHEKKL